MTPSRKARTAGLIAGLTGAFLVVVPGPAAYAHGGTIFPATRTYACFVDGLAGGQGGDLNPTNPACATAFQATNDRFAFWNWFGNLISNAGGRHREIIPDGQLCGPNPSFAAFNAARLDWPTTAVLPGANVTMRYNAWAPHPGTWSSFVTRDDWDPSQPLRWADLETAPFNTVTNPALDGTGPHGREYTWPATLPANKTGRHIIYTIMQRSDSPEAFYNCSDVWFGPGAPPPPPPPPPPLPTTCTVTYTTTANWTNGFTADVTVTNTGTNPAFGWTARWSYPSGQQITGFWNSDIRQNGADVTAINVRWNLRIDPGQSVTFGFQGTHSGTNTPPATLTACQPPQEQQAQQAPSTSGAEPGGWVARLVSIVLDALRSHARQPDHAQHQHGG